MRLILSNLSKLIADRQSFLRLFLVSIISYESSVHQQNQNYIITDFLLLL